MAQDIDPVGAVGGDRLDASRPRSSGRLRSTSLPLTRAAIYIAPGGAVEQLRERYYATGTARASTVNADM